MDHVGRIFRPPSEARSLLLQVTVGCSHNKCTYCAMYTDPEQAFRVKPIETVRRDILEAAASGLPIRRIFLCDGDALILSTEKLIAVLELIREHLPLVRRVGIYGDARTVLRKSPEDLAVLQALGLGIVYHGVESGDDQVLRRIAKGSTAGETAEAADRLRTAGIRHSVIVMLGIGGTERSAEHAAATADLLTRIDPPYVGALTTTIVPGTPLAVEQDSGTFTLPDAWGMLEELETIIDRARFSRCMFHANHASNYLPLRLNLPVDREKGLGMLRAALRERDPSLLVPEGWRGL
jgi:radical SAM superfamily enzyme YgiQ (UPF0313 family)